MDKQKIIGHRGYSGIAPENTAMSFEIAHIFNFDGIEMDVHMSKDGELIVIHDETLDRTCDGAGGYVKDLTLKEIKEANASAKFYPPAPAQTILTLKEFLDQFSNKFDFINIEIKTDQIEYPGIEGKIVDTLKNYENNRAHYLLSSFNYQSLVRVSKLNPNLDLGFLWWKISEFKKIDKQELKQVCKYLNPWTVLYDKHKSEYDKLNMPYALWTIASKKSHEKYVNDPKVKFQICNYKF